MSEIFRAPEDYELFLYTLVERFPIVSRSTLVFARVGASMARISGELFMQNGIKLIIDGYGYEVWRGDEKLYWYDSQPHPNEPALQSSHPHHKHIHPDIKRNRIPAPEIQFDRPNIIWLIEEAGKL